MWESPDTTRLKCSLPGTNLWMVSHSELHPRNSPETMAFWMWLIFLSSSWRVANALETIGLETERCWDPGISKGQILLYITGSAKEHGRKEMCSRTLPGHPTGYAHFDPLLSKPTFLWDWPMAELQSALPTVPRMPTNLAGLPSMVDYSTRAPVETVFFFWLLDGGSRLQTTLPLRWLMGKAALKYFCPETRSLAACPPQA